MAKQQLPNLHGIFCIKWRTTSWTYCTNDCNHRRPGHKVGFYRGGRGKNNIRRMHGFNPPPSRKIFNPSGIDPCWPHSRILIPLPLQKPACHRSRGRMQGNSVSSSSSINYSYVIQRKQSQYIYFTDENTQCKCITILVQNLLLRALRLYARKIRLFINKVEHFPATG